MPDLGTMTAAAEPEEELLPTPEAIDDSEPSDELAPPEERPEDSTPEVEPPAQEPDWAAIVAESPNRIAEVPKRQLPTVLEQLQQRRETEWTQRLAWEQHQANQRAQQAAQQAFETGRQRAQAEAEARYIDALLADENDYEKLQEFARLQNQQPDLIRRYWQTKQNVAQQPAPAAPQADLQGQYNALLGRLGQLQQQNPDAYQDLVAPANWDYAWSPEGMYALARDIERAFKRPKPEKQPEPRTGNQKVKEAAKAEVTGGNGSKPGKLTTEKFMKLPPEEQARMWKERPDEVMALR